MTSAIGYVARSADEQLHPVTFERRDVGAEDVRIEIAYCGVCHSDVHQVRDELGGPLATNYPCMPGHEIVGVVAEVGDAVTRHAVGDRVGVGCLVYWGDESQRGVEEEQYQDPPAVFTYNGEDPVTGQVTLGGYSSEVVVHEHFVLSIPDAIALEEAAPLLCAGVTTWAPLRLHEVGADSRVAIAGLGGLGHIAAKLAKARGAHVTAITTSGDKVDAIRDATGVDAVIVIDDEKAVEQAAASFDLVLSTIPKQFDLKPYLSMLRHDGVFHTVGLLEPVEEGAIDFGLLSMQRQRILGSLIGSLAETQEVLDFAAEHGVRPEVQVIPIQKVNDAFDEVVSGDVRFRYVIDAASLADDADAAEPLDAR